MVLGNYYLTMEEAYDKNNPDTHINRNEGRFFSSFEEANIALANGEMVITQELLLNLVQLINNLQKNKTINI